MLENSKLKRSNKIAVVIPCYRVRRHVASVLSSIPRWIWRIYVVDDSCPEKSGDYVEEECKDGRIKVLRHLVNQGVGGAMATGYKHACLDGASIIVKIDGDGQMDPSLICRFVQPIISRQADYTKGNRFFYPENLRQMPTARLVGNAALSFLTKASSGYWNIFDPTNGFTAINASIVSSINLEKISNRYFFESDILFRLNLIEAVVLDVPMESKYGDEVSNLKIYRVIPHFLFNHMKNFNKRIFYKYFLRGFSIASVEIFLGTILFLFGTISGVLNWRISIDTGVVASAGTVMVSALPIILGAQMLLAFFSFDISNTPRHPIASVRGNLIAEPPSRDLLTEKE